MFLPPLSKLILVLDLFFIILTVTRLLLPLARTSAITGGSLLYPVCGGGVGVCVCVWGGGGFVCVWGRGTCTVLLHESNY